MRSGIVLLVALTLLLPSAAARPLAPQATAGTWPGEILLAWDPGGGLPTLTQYTIHRAEVPVWSHATVVARITSQYHYADQGLVPGRVYYYWFTTTTHGSTSGPTEAIAARALSNGGAVEARAFSGAPEALARLPTPGTSVPSTGRVGADVPAQTFAACPEADSLCRKPRTVNSPPIPSVGGPLKVDEVTLWLPGGERFATAGPVEFSGTPSRPAQTIATVPAPCPSLLAQTACAASASTPAQHVTVLGPQPGRELTKAGQTVIHVGPGTRVGIE